MRGSRGHGRGLREAAGVSYGDDAGVSQGVEDASASAIRPESREEASLNVEARERDGDIEAGSSGRLQRARGKCAVDAHPSFA